VPNSGVIAPYVQMSSLSPFNPLLLVHFESCPFERWERKFYKLAKLTDAELEKIPFPFYRDSIR